MKYILIAIFSLMAHFSIAEKEVGDVLTSKEMQAIRYSIWEARRGMKGVNVIFNDDTFEVAMKKLVKIKEKLNELKDDLDKSINLLKLAKLKEERK